MHSIIQHSVKGVILLFLFTQVIRSQPFQGEKIFPEQIAPLLEGMGTQYFDITSDNELAHIFFNQAVALTFGFNHLEAGRSYKQVSLLDTTSGIAYWGQALVLGPNINVGMETDAVKPAYEAIQKALELKSYESAKEQALIEALAFRYSKDETLSDRAQLDLAYADAMRKVAEQFPDDPDVATFLAEALMVIHAWDYWEGDGRPKEWTPEIVQVLESALAKHPDHPGLIHYYIHAVEASKRPGRALSGAKKLGDLIPGSGHIVHMPSHVYIRTGLYHEGSLANEQAIIVDNDYITQCRQQGIYPLAYVPHNRHFLWATATLEGASVKAIMAAKHMADHIDQKLMREPGLSTLQHFWITPVYAYVKFGKWDKILSFPKPEKDLIYPLSIWHYARGMAYTSKGELKKARKELSTLTSMSRKEELRDINVWEINEAYDVVQIAVLSLEGEIEAKAKNYDTAIARLREAAALEDRLNYNEPSDWHSPVRLTLGAVLMEAGKYKEAEKAYLEDLETFPENGWSLYGLYKSLLKQERIQEAVQVEQRFTKAWKWADVKLKSSRVL